MKENVEVVVKVGFDNKEMSIMTTAIKNVEYSTRTCNGNVYIYHLSIRNARIMSNKHREYNAEYGRDYYSTRDEDLWVYESPKPIEFYIARTVEYESPEEDDSKYATKFVGNRPYTKVKVEDDDGDEIRRYTGGREDD